MHLLAPADAGGLERVVHSLAVGQHLGGHRVVVVPVVERWDPDHTFATPLERAGVELRPLEAPARGYLLERAAFARILDEVAPDVVHSHGYHTDVVDGDVARRAGIATVSTAPGFTKGPWRNRLYEYRDTRALKRFDAVVAVSRPLAE
ncbi:MAG TPA: glycosyltransferase, partial [Gemmatimonadaceae bacterium]|nr:glycosyltransferase [Gemmatimonadaceae bacterium]